MRVFEVILKSEAKAEITAEVLHEDSAKDNKVYFYNDKCQRQLVAYFNRDDIVGIVLGPDNTASNRQRLNRVQRYRYRYQ
jgi:hypothetical protein